MTAKPSYGELQSMLRESEAKYRRIFEIIQDAYFEASPEGTILEISPSIDMIADYQREDLIGKPIYNLCDSAKDCERLARALQHNENLSDYKLHIRSKTGARSYCSINLISTPGGVNGTPQTIGSLRNISRRKEAEDALQKSREQLYHSQKMESLGTLVAGVAHEINNPINLVMFNMPLIDKVWRDFLPVLKAHAAQNPEQKFGGLTYDFLKENLGQLLADIDMAANRVAKIVTDLKNFSRQSDVEEKNPIQINQAIENAVRLAQTTIRKSGVQLELDLAPDLPLRDGNLQSVEQIVLNIIINAIQAIDHDHGKIKIATGFQSREGRICITVSDNGRGIDAAIADRLFDPFVTDKQTQGGTGLGLSVSYSLVKAHDGDITFHTDPDQGTTFSVSFPTVTKAETAKILLVDDNKLIRDILKEALTTGRHYLVDEASNGIEACIKLGSYRPDLLILDIFMPEMDGVEVCRTLKKDPDLSNINVIITTGFPDHPKLKEAEDLGFDNIIFKPFNLGHLQEVVDRLLIT